MVLEANPFERVLVPKVTAANPSEQGFALAVPVGTFVLDQKKSASVHLIAQADCTASSVGVSVTEDRHRSSTNHTKWVAVGTEEWVTVLFAEVVMDKVFVMVPPTLLAV